MLPQSTAPAHSDRSRESGMTMLAVMGFMVIFAMALLAVAPSIHIEVQREKELEALRRGEEISEAIKQYLIANNGRKLPESIDDLLEGIPDGTKKRMILRPSAAVDPLSEDGRWLLVKPEPKTIASFARRVQIYNNGLLPPNSHSVLDRYSLVLVNVLNTGTEEAKAELEEYEYETSTDNTPFIGVTSQSKSPSVLTYYGIENHSKWLFTPLFRGGQRIRPDRGPRGGGIGAGNGSSNSQIIVR